MLFKSQLQMDRASGCFYDLKGNCIKKIFFQLRKCFRKYFFSTIGNVCMILLKKWPTLRNSYQKYGERYSKHKAKWARNFNFIGITVVFVIINWKKGENIGPNLTKKGQKVVIVIINWKEARLIIIRLASFLPYIRQ